MTPTQLTPEQQRKVEDTRELLQEAWTRLALSRMFLTEAGLSGWDQEARDLEEAVRGLRDGLEKIL